MAKRFLMVLAVLSLATAVFAEGQNEQGPGWGPQGQKLTLKGTVSFQGFPHPMLKVGDKQYLLMVPPYLVARSGVKDGAQVSVQGYAVSDFPRWGSLDKNVTGLFVTQATINGKDYDLSRYYGRGRRGFGPGGFGPGFCPGYGAGYGPGYGMMGGYGPGYGMMGGYGRGYGMMGGDWDDR